MVLNNHYEQTFKFGSVQDVPPQLRHDPHLQHFYLLLHVASNDVVLLRCQKPQTVIIVRFIGHLIRIPLPVIPSSPANHKASPEPTLSLHCEETGVIPIPHGSPGQVGENNNSGEEK